MRLSFYSGNIYKGKLYFSSCYYNALFERDMYTGEIHTVSLIDKEEGNPILYRQSFRYGDDIWFIPGNANNILRLNTESRRLDYFEFLNLCKTDPQDKTGLHFGETVRDGSLLYLIPYAVDKLFRIDMRTSEVSVFAEPSLAEGRKIISTEMVNGRIYMFLDDYVTCVEMDSKDAEDQRMIKWNASLNGEPHMRTIYANGKIWFPPKKGEHVCVWDVEINEIEKIVLNGEKENSYYGGVACKDEVVLFPFYSKHFLIIDSKTHNVRTIRKNECDYIFANGENIMTPIESDEGNYITTGGMGAYFKYNNSFDDYKVFPLDTKNKDVYTVVQKITKSNKMLDLIYGKEKIYHEEEIGLVNFLGHILE